MQMIHDALLPEQLDTMRKMFDREESETPEQRAVALDRQLRAKQAELAEAEDRGRHERRKAAALARSGA